MLGDPGYGVEPVLAFAGVLVELTCGSARARMVVMVVVVVMVVRLLVLRFNMRSTATVSSIGPSDSKRPRQSCSTHT